MTVRNGWELDPPDDPADWPVAFPSWVTGFRPWQVDAAVEIAEGFARGATAMILDAPTGTGKTLIAEMVRRLQTVPVRPRATYIAHSVTLQDQFFADFPYAHVVKGRSNYPTMYGGADITAEDCDGPRECVYCEPEDCPYRVALGQAMNGNLAVVNTAYWLYSTNHTPADRNLGSRDLLVVDEADTFEAALMSFVEVRVTDTMRSRAKMAPLKKGAHKASVVKWLGELEQGLTAHIQHNYRGDLTLKGKRERKAVARLKRKIAGFTRGYVEDGDSWVRDYSETAATVWKPVEVHNYADSIAWSKAGENVLAMSASIINPSEWAASNGLDAAGLEWGEVTVASPFAVENRPVKYMPVANMGRKGGEGEVGAMLDAVVRLVAREDKARVLVHTVNYRLAQMIVDALRRETTVETFTHSTAATRNQAIGDYMDAGPGAVLVSPSLDRGLDLPGDACRTQIIAKVPFPNLGDKQISTKLYRPGGQLWYDTLTARTLVQMTGRAVRNGEDYATTWILDKQFGRWWRKGQRLMPSWWREALKTVPVSSIGSIGNDSTEQP